MHGQMIHDWLVLDEAEPAAGYQKRWLCLCTSCSTDYIVLQASLRNGRSQRCKGCSADAKTTHSTLESKRLAGYKQGAKRRDYDFNLTNEQALAFMRGDCHYCGVGNIGIDRVDNTQGYSVDNCVSCCTICNRAKADLSLTQFKEWIQRVAKKEFT